MKHFRLIISKPQDAFYNMALDEALFLSYLKTGVPFFRIYYWDSPSFSIGISLYDDSFPYALIGSEVIRNAVKSYAGFTAAKIKNAVIYKMGMEDIDDRLSNICAQLESMEEDIRRRDNEGEEWKNVNN
jgi:hypothetical protein